MAIKITERAYIVAKGTIRQNDCGYTIYADTQVGQRVQATYANRYWLVIKPKDGKRIITSTQKEAVYSDWMQLVGENGITA